MSRTCRGGADGSLPYTGLRPILGVTINCAWARTLEADAVIGVRERAARPPEFFRFEGAQVRSAPMTFHDGFLISSLIGPI
jgi:hypothetical protein